MKKHNLAFIDLETTGFSPEKHEIIEIGCVVAKQIQRDGKGPALEKIVEFDIKVKPTRLKDADPDALDVNGYNDADWLFATDLKSAMQALSDKTENANMVAQNVSFDAGFLDKAFFLTGVENKMRRFRIDTISMFLAKYYDDQTVHQYSLKYMCEKFSIENSKAHTALSDARATFEVYKKLMGA
jgi:DNA polymerase-3 subunit epsilon